VKPRTHLFVAAQTAFGEAVLGLRIAHELAARGDRIVFLAGDALAVLTKGTPYKTISVAEGEHKKGLTNLVKKAVAEVRPDSIILLDATLVYWLLKAQKTDATFIRDVGVPVIGLDVWNTREAGLTWDVCGMTWEHSRFSLDVTRRLVPVPFTKPPAGGGDGPVGLYDALPEPITIDPDERKDLRADLGLGPKDRLLLLTSARWQNPATQAHEMGRRLAANLPALAGSLIAQAGSDVCVVHVGPEAYTPLEKLGKRYTWLSQRTPARFATLLAASDLLLTFNFSATTIVSAIASGLPVLLGVNKYDGTADEVAARLPESPSPSLRAWLKQASPVAPYKVWPLGLHRFLGPVSEDNPYTTAVRRLEVLEERPFVAAMRELLFDETARAKLREEQAAYCRVVAKLPKAADLVARYLA
jgi:hypothetical protein